MKALLTEARQSQDKENTSSMMRSLLLTTTADAGTTSQQFSSDEHAQLQREMARDTAGGLRLGTRFVSWVKLKHFEGSVLRIQTLHEGLRGDLEVSVSPWLYCGCCLPPCCCSPGGDPPDGQQYVPAPAYLAMAGLV
jgi:hypothetical protein